MTVLGLYILRYFRVYLRLGLYFRDAWYEYITGNAEMGK